VSTFLVPVGQSLGTSSPASHQAFAGQVTGLTAAADVSGPAAALQDSPAAQATQSEATLAVLGLGDLVPAGQGNSSLNWVLEGQ